MTDPKAALQALSDALDVVDVNAADSFEGDDIKNWNGVIDTFCALKEALHPEDDPNTSDADALDSIKAQIAALELRAKELRSKIEGEAR